MFYAAKNKLLPPAVLTLFYVLELIEIVEKLEKGGQAKQPYHAVISLDRRPLISMDLLVLRFPSSSGLLDRCWFIECPETGLASSVAKENEEEVDIAASVPTRQGIGQIVRWSSGSAAVSRAYAGTPGRRMETAGLLYGDALVRGFAHCTLYRPRGREQKQDSGVLGSAPLNWCRLFSNVHNHADK